MVQVTLNTYGSLLVGNWLFFNLQVTIFVFLLSRYGQGPGLQTFLADARVCVRRDRQHILVWGIGILFVAVAFAGCLGRLPICYLLSGPVMMDEWGEGRVQEKLP